MNSSAHFQRKLDGQFVFQVRIGNTDLGVISVGVDGYQA